MPSYAARTAAFVGASESAVAEGKGVDEVGADVSVEALASLSEELHADSANVTQSASDTAAQFRKRTAE
jgi:hypothetical protein